MEKARKKSGGARKHGRNKVKCAKYKTEHRRENNKIKKWQKLIKNLETDNNMRRELENRIKSIKDKTVVGL